MTRIKLVVSIFMLFLATTPSVMACATCFGASDSPMAKGMNWGIFTLLAVIILMLTGIALFFIFLARRSAEVSPFPEQLPLENEAR